MAALAWIGTVIFFVLAMACTSLTFATWFNLPNDRFTGVWLSSLFWGAFAFCFYWALNARRPS